MYSLISCLQSLRHINSFFRSHINFISDILETKQNSNIARKTAEDLTRRLDLFIRNFDSMREALQSVEPSKAHSRKLGRWGMNVHPLKCSCFFRWRWVGVGLGWREKTQVCVKVCVCVCGVHGSLFFDIRSCWFGIQIMWRLWLALQPQALSQAKTVGWHAEHYALSLLVVWVVVWNLECSNRIPLESTLVAEPGQLLIVWLMKHFCFWSPWICDCNAWFFNFVFGEKVVLSAPFHHASVGSFGNGWRDGYASSFYTSREQQWLSWWRFDFGKGLPGHRQFDEVWIYRQMRITGFKYAPEIEMPSRCGNFFHSFFRGKDEMLERYVVRHATELKED